MAIKIIDSISIKELDDVKLVGFRVQCPGDQFVNEIPKASQLLQHRQNEIKYVVNPHHQIGAFIVEENSPDEDGYWMCLEVAKYGDIPEGMVALTVPAQRYAALKYKGGPSPPYFLGLKKLLSGLCIYSPFSTQYCRESRNTVQNQKILSKIEQIHAVRHKPTKNDIRKTRTNHHHHSNRTPLQKIPLFRF